MQRYSKGWIIILMGVLFLVAACASQQPLVTMGHAKGEIAVAVTASSFKFEPNNIKAFKGDVLVVKLQNVSDSGHNFTVKDPLGQTVQNVTLPSKETVAVKITLSETGTYEFYCDKPFHSTFGMKGQIIVVQEP